MTTDDRRELRAQRRAARIAETIRGEVISGLMSYPHGRGYVWSVLAETHVFATSFATDPLLMAFAEGERNFGLRLLNDVIEQCPDLFLLMIQEQNNASGRRNQPDDDNSEPDSDSDGDYDR